MYQRAQLVNHITYHTNCYITYDINHLPGVPARAVGTALRDSPRHEEKGPPPLQAARSHSRAPTRSTTLKKERKKERKKEMKKERKKERKKETLLDVSYTRYTQPYTATHSVHIYPNEP